MQGFLKEYSVLEKNRDSYNLERLGKYRLPVIKSVNHLLDVLGLSDEEDIYFYSFNRSVFSYNSFYIPKRNGEKRLIEAPCKELKIVLKAIDSVFFRHFELSPSCCAYIRGRSIIDNAFPHLGAKTLLKFDIHDFFPSINLQRIVYLFRYYGYGTNVSRCLGYLCVNKDYVLPQGAPTSPMISNLVSVRLDARINGYCKAHFNSFGLRYTRYADDITISSLKRLSKKDIETIRKTINDIIIDEGFTPNYEKFKLFRNGQRMLVTSVNVNSNDCLHVDKKRIRKMEISIHCMKKYGVEEHIKFLNKKENTFWDSKSYSRHIFGLAFYIKMIDRKKGNKYLSELKRIFNTNE